MADNYTQLSTAFVLPNKAADWLMATLRLTEWLGEEYTGPETIMSSALKQDFHSVDKSVQDTVRILVKTYPEAYGIIVDSCSAEPDKDEEHTVVSLHSMETAHIDILVDIIHYTLRHFNLPEGIGFSWANTCSKPRVDEFGGGAVWITRDGPVFLDTGMWLLQKAKIHQEC